MPALHIARAARRQSGQCGQCEQCGKLRTRHTSKARLLSYFGRGLINIMLALLKGQPLPLGRFLPLSGLTPYLLITLTLLDVHVLLDKPTPKSPAPAPTHAGSHNRGYGWLANRAGTGTCPYGVKALLEHSLSLRLIRMARSKRRPYGL
jgi:hypothetical protein